MNEKKQIIIIIGLLIVLVAVWVLVLQPSKKNKYNADMSESEKETGLEFKVIVEKAEKYFQYENSIQKISYEKDKDPFSLERRKIADEVGVENKVASELFRDLVLKGILWDSRRPLAIINGEVLSAGNLIRGVTVKTIAPDHVVLEFQGEEKILFIEGVKRVGR